MTVLCDMHAWAAKVHPPSSMTTKQPPFTIDEARVAISPSGESSPYSGYPSMLIRPSRLSLLATAVRLAELEVEDSGCSNHITHDIIKFVISQLCEI